MASHAPREGRAGFAGDLWHFAVICLGGIIVALLVLPGRARSLLDLLNREERVRAEISAIEAHEAALGEACEALENDPHYRDAMFRRTLGVRRENEVALEPRAEPFPVIQQGASLDIPQATSLDQVKNRELLSPRAERLHVD